MKTKLRTLVKENKIEILLKNKNFRNSQNYILGKNIINSSLHLINVTENKKNIINLNENKKIQEIDISLIKNKQSNLAFFVLLFGLITYISILFLILQKGFKSSDINVIIYLTTFLGVYIYLFIFYKNNDYIILKNKNKIIFLKKN